MTCLSATFAGYTLNSKQPAVAGGFLPALALPVFVFVCEAPFLLPGESRSHPARQALAPLRSNPIDLAFPFAERAQTRSLPAL